jgi:toxic protein SymE
MANPHSTSDSANAKTERQIIVGYRPQGRDRSTPSLQLSGKWMRDAGFDTGRYVTVKVIQGCIVLMACDEKEQGLMEELKAAKQALKDIQHAVARI